MNHEDYYQPIDYLTTRPIGLTYIRMLHASADAPGVDIYLNDRLIAKNLTYKSFTPYLGMPQGNYSISVYRYNQTNNPITHTYIDTEISSIYTAAVIGELPDIELYPIIDPVIPPLINKARIRFVHLSPNAPEVDIELPDGTRLFSDIGYKGITNYVSLYPGKYTLQALTVNTDNVVLNVPNIILRPGRNLSIYAVGLVDGNPTLQVLIPLDGSSYLPI